MTQTVVNYSPFTEWIPKVSEAGNLQLAEIIQLELYRYLLSRTNSFGAVCADDGNLNIVETNAAFQIRYMSMRLTERFVCKSLVDLLPLLKPRLGAAASGRKDADDSSVQLYSLNQFNKFTSLVQLLEFVSKQDIFEAFGCRAVELIKDFLSKFRTSDALFAESGKVSSLTDTRRAVAILYAYGIDIDEFDPKLRPALKKALVELRCPTGGFCDSLKEKIPTAISTYSGVYISHMIDDAKTRISMKNEPKFAAATVGFFEQMLTPGGGYREDGLTPSATLKSTAGAVLTVGMLNDYKYTSLPRKKIIAYLDRLDLDDSGAAPDEWTQVSDLESTLLGLVIRLLLKDELVTPTRRRL